MKKEYGLCSNSVTKSILFDIFILIIASIFIGTENMNNLLSIIISIFLIGWAIKFGNVYRIFLDNDNVTYYTIYGKRTIKWRDVKKVEFDEIRLGRYYSTSLALIFHINNNQYKTISKRKIYIKYISEKIEIVRIIKRICKDKNIQFKNFVDEFKI